jgi:hypothetical protein
MNPITSKLHLTPGALGLTSYQKSYTVRPRQIGHRTERREIIKEVSLLEKVDFLTTGMMHSERVFR